MLLFILTLVVDKKKIAPSSS